jgi:hypothetical protein
LLWRCSSQQLYQLSQQSFNHISAGLWKKSEIHSTKHGYRFWISHLKIQHLYSTKFFILISLFGSSDGQRWMQLCFVKPKCQFDKSWLELSYHKKLISDIQSFLRLRWRRKKRCWRELLNAANNLVDNQNFWDASIFLPLRSYELNCEQLKG